MYLCKSIYALTTLAIVQKSRNQMAEISFQKSLPLWGTTCVQNRNPSIENLESQQLNDAKIWNQSGR